MAPEIPRHCTLTAPLSWLIDSLTGFLRFAFPQPSEGLY